MGHATVENYASGIDLQHDESKLLDLRFADDLLLFARTEFETIFMLEVFDFDESGGNCPERERCLGCILTKDAGRSTLDITDIIYTPLQGRSLPTNRFSVTRMFVSQFGFIS